MIDVVIQIAFDDQIRLHRRHLGTLVGYYIYWCLNERIREISRSTYRSTRLWELAEVCDVLLTEEDADMDETIKEAEQQQ